MQDIDVVLIAGQGVVLGITFAVLERLEAKFGRHQFPEVPHWRLEGSAFIAVVFAIYAVVPTICTALTPEGYSLFETRQLDLWWRVPIGIAVLSFSEYWLHRAQHSSRFLWLTTHQVHHYPKRVDIFGSAHEHPLGMTLRAVNSYFINVLVLGLDVWATAICTYVLTVLGVLQHLNVHIPRRLGYFVPRPEAHFFHHERGRHSQNYGRLPLWDIIFGTFHNPETFSGNVGFAGKPTIADMLRFVDVNRS